jgi:AraC family transcriptional regulator of adaptative response/methylated-DNA-[protein]-cysteine methyltransferase
MEAPGPPPSLGGLAEATGLSRFHLHRVFAALTGVTPKAYAMACRTERLHEEILRTRTVTEAIYQAGFNSSGSFYAVAPQLLGMTPTAYRNRGRGTRIEHLPARSSLGPLLLATTPAGVCAVLFDEDASALLPALRGLFSAAELAPAGPAAARRLTAALRSADRLPQSPQLPGDIRRRALGERVRAAALLHTRPTDD